MQFEEPKVIDALDAWRWILPPADRTLAASPIRTLAFEIRSFHPRLRELTTSPFLPTETCRLRTLLG
jgi:hypothetical protein